MNNQMNEAFSYIEREYKDAKGRVELQRRVVEQLHMVEADAGEAEAVLNALSDDEASKLRILDYLRKWLGDELEDCQPIASSDSAMESIMMGWCDMGSQIGPQVLKPVHLILR
jgi:hypothetical protein